MLPGISAEDCLVADLGIDPASSGCQSYEANDGDQLPELSNGYRLALERRPAFTAELDIVRILTPAVGTRLHKGV